MVALKGYYDGVHFISDESIDLEKGQRVIIYVVDHHFDKTSGKIDLNRYVGKSERMLDIDAQEYVNGLRENDRV